MRDRFHWARLLAFVTGLVNQDLLLRNEYLIAENRILRGHLPMRLRLADPERVTLAEIAKRLGRKALKDVAQVAKPDTILAWYRRLIAQKFDGSRIWLRARDPGIDVDASTRALHFSAKTSQQEDWCRNTPPAYSVESGPTRPIGIGQRSTPLPKSQAKPANMSGSILAPNKRRHWRLQCVKLPQNAS